jgi:hypothetical protein
VCIGNFKKFPGIAPRTPINCRGRRYRKEGLAGKMDGRKERRREEGGKEERTGMVEGKVSPMLAYPS